MKFVTKSFLGAVHKYRSVYHQPHGFFSQNNKPNPFKKNNDKKHKTELSEVVMVGTAIAAFLGCQIYYLYQYEQRKEIELQPTCNKSNSPHPPSSLSVEAGKFKEGLPSYRPSEIRKHNCITTRLWASYKEGVYDLTDFVKVHPGGSNILRAGGTTLEPFFFIYPVHDSKQVHSILEKYRIGNLGKDPCPKPDFNDPFSLDPVRHGALYGIVNKPFNGGTEPALLVDNFFTPNELFYVRNHMYVPDLDPVDYKLDLELEGEPNKVTLSLDDIKNMPKCSVTSTLMCIGNRRTEMLKIKPMSAVVHWNNSAMGCAEWTGVKLRDVLQLIGVDGENEKHQHVHFEGYDHDNSGTHFGGSIPMWRAVDKRTDVILAYEMNGKPLSRDHGYPLRLVLPGCAGVRQVKWLAKIWVSDKESTAHWYANEYKGFSPSTDWNNVDFSSAPAAMETPVTSSICYPVDGDTVQVVDGHVRFKGYAWSGNGNRIIRMDITADGGKTWLNADLEQLATAPPKHWTWTLWSIDIPVDKNTTEIEVWAKAVDSSYNSQPESFENVYNFRGVMCNAYPRVKVKLSR